MSPRAARNFNPRSREGSDNRPTSHTHHPRNFNPRSREGSDAAMSGVTEPPCDFNPRSREGSDRPSIYVFPTV